MRSFVFILASAALLVCSFTTVSFADYSRGPDPTNYDLESNRGPFSYRSTSISSWRASGYGGGTLFYPTNTNEGPFAGVVVCPGYMESDGMVDWWGPRLASNGFIVLVMQPLMTAIDQPPARARQMMSALEDMVSWSNSRFNDIYGLLDTSRFALMGHSMGGGGSLIAAEDNANDPRIKAVIPQAPWAMEIGGFSGIKAPTLVVACQSDIVAPVMQHASPFYRSLTDDLEKMFIEFRLEDHFCVIDGNSHYELLGKLGISWLKVFVDEDARYLTYLNDINYGSEWEVSDFRSNRPYDLTTPGECQDVRATISEHVDAGRAYDEIIGCETTHYAVGSNDDLGTSSYSSITLRSTDVGNTWEEGSCP